MPKDSHMVERIKELESAQNNWEMEREAMSQRINSLEEMVKESKVGGLRGVKSTLKFQESENLIKPFICIQLEDGTMLYFDNVKPFDLFTIIDGTRIAADLSSPLEGEYDCSFKGAMGNFAYFRSVRGKIVKFFAACVKDGRIQFHQIDGLKTSEISLFKNQPFYFVELSRDWAVYHFDKDNYVKEGEKFDISGIDHLSKYDRHYHRGLLYLFRENSTACIDYVNNKVVRVEGPLLDIYACSFYTPCESDFIYILNSDHNVLLILNTTNMTVTQLLYEPPSDSNNHSIVGIHKGILTMAFDGVWGRHLYTAKIS
ncbi:hypothetical protein PRIPAC_88651 [Pristionchus pacificus]|uniref:Uncharacterized protein n=1 Tax=Pristionchus pacificus TaxID=54126 RepID=A0A2A6CX65_PRIPA|nr:hypothetical protein PRIPAC_88651 [Pristionchus pacificus]|eukprot:PDM82621.1 hypothetical protein PRIPAC_37014 [Pristionchus pacificus]